MKDKSEGDVLGVVVFLVATVWLFCTGHWAFGTICALCTFCGSVVVLTDDTKVVAVAETIPVEVQKKPHPLKPKKLKKLLKKSGQLVCGQCRTPCILTAHYCPKCGNPIRLG